jgi:hypothetical protein
MFRVTEAGKGYTRSIWRKHFSQNKNRVYCPTADSKDLNNILKFRSYLKVNSSALGIATGYELNGRRIGVRVQVCGGGGDCFPLHVLQTGSGLRPASYTMDKQDLSPVPVKWPGHEAKHSSPSRTKFKNTWICSSSPS